MRRSFFVFLAVPTCLLLCAASAHGRLNAQTTSSSSTSSASKSSAAKPSSSSTTAHSASTTTHPTAAHATATAAKKTTTSRRRRRTATRFVPKQKAPTADRITEIQTALSRGGYYQGDPNGKWDASTISALQKFQSANGIEATGKLDAPSLQKLGLGSDIAGVSAPRPPAPAGTAPQSAAPPASSTGPGSASGNAPGFGSSSASGTANSSSNQSTTAASISPSAGSLATKPPQQ